MRIINGRDAFGGQQRERTASSKLDPSASPTTFTATSTSLSRVDEQVNDVNRARIKTKSSESNMKPGRQHSNTTGVSAGLKRGTGQVGREPAAAAHQTKAQANHRSSYNQTSATASCDHDHDDKSTRLLVILFLIGLIICVTSITCILLLPSLISNQIAKKLVLKNNSMLLERWSKPNVPMYFKVWLYDFKNAQEIIDKRNTKPLVQEIGPFVFNLRRQKDVISFAGDNLYYTERKVYHFNRELSCCAINTTVTIPNIPLVAVVDRALGYNLPLLGRFVPRLINRAIQSLREQLFVRKQVNEILFDGYDVELLRMVSRVGSLVGLPQQSQKFALLKGRNDTWRPEQDGVWAINTGQRDRRQFGRVASWNSYKRLPFWPADQCNVINGSDGTLFPPPIKNTEPLYIFNQELCRTVNLVYNGPSDVRSIQAYRFVLSPMNFAHTMNSSSGLNMPAAVSRNVPVAERLTQRLTGAREQVGREGPQPAQRGQRLNPMFQNKPLGPGPSPETTVDTRRARPNQSGGGQPLASANERRQQEVKPEAANSETMATTKEMEMRNEQEKLVRVAQEAQLASERGRMNPQACFCDRKTTNLNGLNVCELDGLIDLSRCSKQAQVIFGSMPHFYNSDPRLLNQVAGLAPNASRHTTYLDIEPNTGLVLGGKRRVQLNVIIKHNNEIDGFENINDMLLPVVWFEESALIPEETARKFKSMYSDKIRLINLILFSLLTASIVLLAVDTRLLLTTRRWRRFKLRHLQSGGGSGGAQAQRKRTTAKLDCSAAAEGAGAKHWRNQSEHVSRRSLKLASGPLLAKLTAGGGASSPLLLASGTTSPSSAATTATADSTPSLTPPGSPQDSPELRKWSVARVGQERREGVTYVQMNAARQTGNDLSNTHTPGPGASFD